MSEWKRIEFKMNKKINQKNRNNNKIEIIIII